MPRPYEFSSMTALVCFEAAARNASFKKAAQELNVTPAAISHQIKALEMDLKCSLFLRHHRGVELTEKGALLFVVIQRGFEAISETLTQIRERPETVDVTIGATTAFSSLWLTPKISAFWKIHPSITVSQVVSDVPGMTGRCDLTIHYGNPQENGVEYRKLFQDHIIALGTTRFAAEYRISRLEALLKAPLIHSSSKETGWTSWHDWFAALGFPAPKGRSFYVNNYMIALQAAQDDVGAVLGWDGLVGSLVNEGRLVKLVQESIPSPVGFHLRIHRRATAKARLFADWLATSP
ncbi:LysR family transcriptional regulator [Sinorhizobium meliloti]|uniref:LysR substrate-binding domain-containing protein n=1 Tax=Rhizobium meliloti TaxID=382 RepID=UPI000FD86964|nr:LysR substrate-binding domain-containing protein [Sinorhizobium meliloti]RVH44411.1 LysR family transcriptional regulator [Sinorhizobium meliloti]RVH74357.1 LysR family transcriptional regulator [Sinorhizobium meliloti]